MNHHALKSFWNFYDRLPKEIQRAADSSFSLRKANPDHPSLQFKLVGQAWSARVNLGYRVLARRRGQDLYWFWIDPHDEYERLISS